MDKPNDNNLVERRFAEGTWFMYFNKYLFEKGTISEKEYKLMVEKISSRSSRLTNTR